MKRKRTVVEGYREFRCQDCDKITRSRVKISFWVRCEYCKGMAFDDYDPDRARTRTTWRIT